MLSEWLTVQDVAENLKVSERTVRRWLRDGRLTGRHLGGKAGWRIRPEDVTAFMESLPTEPGDDNGAEENDA